MHHFFTMNDTSDPLPMNGTVRYSARGVYSEEITLHAVYLLVLNGLYRHVQERIESYELPTQAKTKISFYHWPKDKIIEVAFWVYTPHLPVNE